MNNHTRGIVVARPYLVMALLLAISFAIFCYASLNIFSATKSGPYWTVDVTIIGIMMLVVFVSAAYLSVGSLYLLTTAYVLMISLFHLGAIVSAGFGLLEDSSRGHFWRVNLESSVWNEMAAWYTIVSLACLGAGFSIAVLTTSERKTATPSSDVGNATLDRAYWAGIGLLLASGVFLVHAIAVFGNLLKYDRFELFFATTNDIRGLGVFTMTFPAAIALLVLGARGRVRQRVMLIFAGLSVILVLLAGDRGIALHPLLVGAVVWVKLGRHIPNAVAIALIGAVLAAIPAVGALRQMGSYEEITRENVATASEESDFMNGFLTMGATIFGLATVIRDVPADYPFRYGTTYVGAAVSSIPNLGPTRSKGDVVQHTPLTSRDLLGKLKPSSWLAYRLLGRDRFLRGQGTGFSGIGEPYFNFGYAGVVAYFLVLGYLLARFDLCKLLTRPRLLIFAVAIYPNFIGTARNDITSFLKPAVFIMIILIIWHIATLFVGLMGRRV